MESPFCKRTLCAACFRIQGISIFSIVWKLPECYCKFQCSPVILKEISISLHWNNQLNYFKKLKNFIFDKAIEFYPFQVFNEVFDHSSELFDFSKHASKLKYKDISFDRLNLSQIVDELAIIVFQKVFLNENYLKVCTWLPWLFVMHSAMFLLISSISFLITLHFSSKSVPSTASVTALTWHSIFSDIELSVSCLSFFNPLTCPKMLSRSAVCRKFNEKNIISFWKKNIWKVKYLLLCTQQRRKELPTRISFWFICCFQFVCKTITVVFSLSHLTIYMIWSDLTAPCNVHNTQVCLGINKRCWYFLKSQHFLFFKIISQSHLFLLFTEKTMDW